jgi:hypothetical protein
MFTFHDESDEEAIDMAFDKNRSEDRRKWILDNYDPHRVADFGERVRLRDFVDEELVNFSNADNIRSIPSVVDGLKPSQRKVSVEGRGGGGPSSEPWERAIAQRRGRERASARSIPWGRAREESANVAQREVARHERGAAGRRSARQGQRESRSRPPLARAKRA